MKCLDAIWVLVPVILWLLSRSLLLPPAQAQLKRAKQKLLFFERAELEASFHLQRTGNEIETLENKRESLISDGNRLKAAQAAATKQMDTVA